MAEIINLDSKNLPSTCIVFKHSTACPTSATAASQIRSAEVQESIYWVNVIEQREISNWIANNYGVRHESPQCLLIRDGHVTSVWNHSSIKAAALEAALKEI